MRRWAISIGVNGAFLIRHDSLPSSESAFFRVIHRFSVTRDKFGADDTRLAAQRWPGLGERLGKIRRLAMRVDRGLVLATLRRQGVSRTNGDAEDEVQRLRNHHPQQVGPRCGREPRRPRTVVDRTASERDARSQAGAPLGGFSFFIARRRPREIATWPPDLRGAALTGQSRSQPADKLVVVWRRMAGENDVALGQLPLGCGIVVPRMPRRLPNDAIDQRQRL